MFTRRQKVTSLWYEILHERKSTSEFIFIICVICFFFCPRPQVCRGHCVQVSAKARVGRQEFCILGSVSVQQLVGGAAQQQRDSYWAFTPPAAPGSFTGLRLRLAVLPRCCRLAALAHLWHRLCPAGLSRVQRVEQMFNNPHWTSHPGSFGRNGLQLTHGTIQKRSMWPNLLHCDHHTLSG